MTLNDTTNYTSSNGGSSGGTTNSIIISRGGVGHSFNNIVVSITAMELAVMVVIGRVVMTYFIYYHLTT
jgi:hypothetical protein